jgi:hypothetical protein
MKYIIILISMLYAHSGVAQFMYGSPKSPKVRDFLSTSLTAFDNASAGALVVITAAEYNLIKAAYQSVGTMSGGDVRTEVPITTSSGGAAAPLINAPANTRLVAFGVATWTGSNRTIQFRRARGPGKMGGAGGYLQISTFTAPAGESSNYVVYKESNIETGIHWYSIWFTSGTLDIYIGENAGSSYAHRPRYNDPFDNNFAIETTGWQMNFEYIYTSLNPW